MNDQAPGGRGDADEGPTGPKRPSPIMRFLVVLFGFILFGTGQSIVAVGGFGAVFLGGVIMAMGVAVVAIAIGLVELAAAWLKGRRGDRDA